VKKLRIWLPVVLSAGAFAVVVSGPAAVATHEPADKTAATASDIDTLGQEQEVILQETMRVSSTSDLILSTSAECSILTALNTVGGEDADTEQDGAFGQVKLFIEIDGTRVPVATNDTAEDQFGDDFGKVVFCNRAYQRTVTDAEENEGVGGNPDGDGLDSEDDFIRTRNANAFNWMAFNVGTAYDKPYNGNNIVDVKLFAQYDRKTTEDGALGANSCQEEGELAQADDALAPYGKTCADAFVGSRSLIVEAVHASNHEQPAPVDDDPTSGGLLP
jgi:hypothetical protein